MRLTYAVFELAVLAAGVCSPATAQAHAPYVLESCDTKLPDGAPAKVVLLYGDGIVVRDSSQPVVLAENGKVVAIGPYSGLNYLICADEAANVIVYSPYEMRVSKPMVSGFAPADDEYDAPEKWYPGPPGKYAPAPYGFESHDASALEMVWLELRGITLELWIWIAIGTVWFAAVWLLLVLPWRFWRKDIVGVALAVVLAVSRLGFFGVLMVASVFLNLTQLPVSFAVLAAMLLLGLLLSLRLRKPISKIGNNANPEVVISP